MPGGGCDSRSKVPLSNRNDWLFGTASIFSNQLIGKISVKKFLDGEQNDGALFFFPKQRDLPLRLFTASTSAEHFNREGAGGFTSDFFAMSGV
jgi:hypothetical protein